MLGVSVAMVGMGSPATADDSTSTTTVAPTMPAPQAEPVPYPLACPPKDQCQVGAHIAAFKDGKLGNAEGMRLPPGIRQRLNKMANAQGVAQSLDDDGKWWRHPLKSMQCLSTTFSKMHCNAGGAQGPDQDAYNQVLEDSSELAFICGGTAALGFSKVGGWWSVGIGMATCLWQTILGKRLGW